MKKILNWLDDAELMRKANGWLAVVWLLAAIPICLWLSSSVPFLVFISVYAVVTGHWAAWQAARVEVKQEQERLAREAEASDSAQ
jgi:hypothetical protein